MSPSKASLFLTTFFIFSVHLEGSIEPRLAERIQPVQLNSQPNIPSVPNIVFLISEDNSKHFLDLFDPMGVETPFIRSMAENGITYAHAFSNSPVCSVARSTLITGTLAIRTGMHLHRKVVPVPMPEGLEMFPAYLRKAGYYTTNNAKKDYNALEAEGVWDDSSNKASWRNRAEVMRPFFHQETFMGSHESSLHFRRDLMGTYMPNESPESVKLFPHFPDTPIFRFTTAYHRDKIREIDRWVGETLRKLEEDGELENTFVFYFGDHGGVLPGSKGYLYETGIHVPLVVRIPQNFRHLVDMERGEVQPGFVSFIDFAPTVLSLAGIDIPSQIDGKAFLGKGIRGSEVANRDEAIGHADRFDEKYDMVRSLRKGKYKYIRSFQPFYPDALQNNYRYQMLAYVEWRALFHAGALQDSIQRRFFLPKPAEMLFDLEQDPFETINLAGDPDYRDVLTDLRGNLTQRLLEVNDLGFLPENVLIKEAIENPVAFGRDFSGVLARLLEIADLGTGSFQKAEARLKSVIESGSDLERYWAITVAAGYGSEASSLAASILTYCQSNDRMVALRAIEFLGIAVEKNPIPDLVSLINTAKDPLEALMALNSLVYFRDHTKFAESFDVNSLLDYPSNEEVMRRINYLKGNW